MRKQRSIVSGFTADEAPYFIKWWVVSIIHGWLLLVTCWALYSLRSPSGDTLMAVLSDGRIRFINASSLATLGTVQRPADGSFVRDACFADEARVWVCYSTGLVVEWLISGVRPQRSFVAAPAHKGGEARLLSVAADDAEERGPFSIAVNAGGDVLVVGYEEHIIFYALCEGRDTAVTAGGAHPRCLGCYSSSHTGPVIQLAWHPVIPRHLISASDDGLVCVFDTGIRGEDDALVAVLNAESGVARFGTFGPQDGFIYVISRTDALSLWNLASSERIAEFGDLKARLCAGGVGVQYLIDCWCSAEGRLQLLAGDHDGQLWALDVTPSGAVLQGVFGPPTHAATIRTALWSQLTTAGAAAGGVVCWTAGEDGLLVQWADEAAQAALSLSTPAAGSGSGSGPVRDVSWRQMSKFAGAPAMGMHGRLVDRESDALSFGRTAARPVSPPSVAAVHSSDLLALLEATKMTT